MNILFLCFLTVDPANGGVERVSETLGNYFLKKGFEVYYLSVTDNLKNLAESRPNQYYLSSESELLSNENITLYRAILKDKQIDLVINQFGNEHQLSRLSYYKPDKVKMVACIHNSVTGLYSTIPLLNRFRLSASFFSTYLGRQLILNYYRIRQRNHYSNLCMQNDKVVLLSNAYISELQLFSTFDTQKVIAIPNPCPYTYSLSNKYKKEKEIIYVGRTIRHQKRLDLLLLIWKKVMSHLPDWRLTIIGEGIDQKEMQEFAVQLNLTRISFEGFQDPLPYYKRASILCLTSAFEGFPMALVEAMRNGVVPVVFDSFKSVRDIIEPSVSGYVVKAFDLKEYAAILLLLANEEDKLAAMRQSCMEKSLSFTLENVGKYWFKLFKSVVEESVYA